MSQSRWTLTGKKKKKKYHNHYCVRPIVKRCHILPLSRAGDCRASRSPMCKSGSGRHYTWNVGRATICYEVFPFRQHIGNTNQSAFRNPAICPKTQSCRGLPGILPCCCVWPQTAHKVQTTSPGQQCERHWGTRGFGRTTNPACQHGGPGSNYGGEVFNQAKS